MANELERVKVALAKRYTIHRELGRGGMATVYLAHDLRHDRPVALKVLKPELAAALGPDRFLREITLTARLDHPHILPLLDSGDAEGFLYYVMPYVEGESLRDRLNREKQLPLEDALRIAREVADGLSYAHSRNIVHRDIKPENILLAGGHARVADFGIARAVSAAGGEMLTGTGLAIGTPTYMSPEQAAGDRAVDARSDVYSLGCVMYEMLAGQPPFTGATAEAILARKSLEAVPSLRVVREAVPLGVEDAIAKALAKVPADRFATASHFAEAMDRAFTAPEPVPRSIRAIHRRRLLLAAGSVRRRWAWAAVLPVLLVAGFLAWREWRAPESTEPLRAVPLTALPGVSRYPSFSPDGNLLAFTWTGLAQDNPDVYVQQIGSTGSPLRLTVDPENDHSPTWSPDGRWIAFLRGQVQSGLPNELRLVPSLGGTERKIAEVRVRNPSVFPPYLAWCPDSRCLVVADSAEGMAAALFVVSPETGEKHQLTHPDPLEPGDTHPAVSPDGRWLVFRRNASGPFTGALYRLRLERNPGAGGLAAAGRPERLTPPTLDASYPAWMPGSREILFSASSLGGSLWRMNVPGARPGVTEPARVPFVGEDGLMPVISRSEPGRGSRLVYVRSFSDANIWRIETSAPGSPASSLPVLAPMSSTQRDYHPQLSPDGRRVAFGSDRSGDAEIWVADLDGSNPVRLTTGATGSGFPHWSPDGERLVFVANIEGQWEDYVIPAAGGRPRNVTAHPAMEAWPSWSRDGQWVYFTSDRTGDFQIWKAPVSGGNSIQLTRNVGLMPEVSPDGAWVYYVQTWNPPSRLWRVPTSGGEPVKVLDGVLFANFTVLEGGIYYIDRPAGRGGVQFIDAPSGETRLRFFDFATGRSTTVARNLGNVFIGLTASPDGHTILYTRVDSAVDDLMLVENFR